MGPKRQVVIKKSPIEGNINEQISQYFLSKKEQQSTLKHYPEWDVVKGDAMIELMRARRELLAADADLASKRFEYRARRQLHEQNWHELREKQKMLRRSFLWYDEFVRENREKRERAERKIRDEQERQQIRKAEIKDLENNLEFLERARNKMQEYVEEYKPFQKYLETVVETNEFQSIAEIFNRYETLIAARAALLKNQDDSLLALESTSSQLQKMTEEKSQSLLDLNSRLAHLQSRYERARAKTLHWESVVAHVKEATTHKELEDVQVRTCVWNLYRQICRRKGVPAEAQRDELEQQLLHVKRTVLELGKIVRAAKRRAVREERNKDVLEARQSLAAAPQPPASSRTSGTRSTQGGAFDDTQSMGRI